MNQFGGVMEYDYMNYEGIYVYYMNCVYAGYTYSCIKFDIVTGIFTLYGENEQHCGSISLKQFV